MTHSKVIFSHSWSVEVTCTYYSIFLTGNSFFKVWFILNFPKKRGFWWQHAWRNYLQCCQKYFVSRVHKDPIAKITKWSRKVSNWIKYVNTFHCLNQVRKSLKTHLRNFWQHWLSDIGEPRHRHPVPFLVVWHGVVVVYSVAPCAAKLKKHSALFWRTTSKPFTYFSLTVLLVLKNRRLSFDYRPSKWWNN